MKNLDKEVKQVLRDYPETRDSDTELVARVWEVYGLEFTPEQRRLIAVIPKTESITRCRRKLQEQGLYRANRQVEKVRKQKASMIREQIPKTQQVASLFDDSAFSRDWDQLRRNWQ